MKRTISLLLSLAFLLGFSGSVFAQDITATAEVLQEIAYDDNNTEINFGNLETSFTSATIDPANTSGDAGVSSNATAARITVTGANDETVLVTDPGTIQLNGPNSDVLDLATSVTGETGDVTTDRGGSTLTNGNELDLNNSGLGTLWIGGDLSVNNDNGDGLDAGTYSNTFTLTLDYL